MAYTGVILTPTRNTLEVRFLKFLCFFIATVKSYSYVSNVCYCVIAFAYVSDCHLLSSSFLYCFGSCIGGQW